MEGPSDPRISGTAGRGEEEGRGGEEGGGRGEGRREEGEERRGDVLVGRVGWDAEPRIWTKSKNRSACRFMLVRTFTSKTQPELALQRISKFFKRRTTCALHVNLFEHLEEAKLFHDPKCFLHLSAVLHNKEEEENIELQLLKFVKEGEGTNTDSEIKEQRY